MSSLSGSWTANHCLPDAEDAATPAASFFHINSVEHFARTFLVAQRRDVQIVVFDVGRCLRDGGQRAWLSKLVDERSGQKGLVQEILERCGNGHGRILRPGDAEDDGPLRRDAEVAGFAAWMALAARHKCSTA